jgi:tetratricopeptide (TPR) repeat protein
MGSQKHLKEGVDTFLGIIKTHLTGNDVFAAKIYQRIAAVFKKQEHTENQRNYLELAKKMLIEKNYNKYFQNITDLNVEIALSHLSDKNYSEAVSYFEQALGVLIDNNQENSLQVVEINKYTGICLTRDGILEEAINCYLRAVNLLSLLKSTNEEQIFELYYLICMIYVKKHDYFVSLEYLKKAKGVMFLKGESVFKKKFCEFYACYKKYLDKIDENIWTNFIWDKN